MQMTVEYLDAPDGTGKTFLINLLLAKVRSTHGIAHCVLDHTLHNRLSARATNSKTWLSAHPKCPRNRSAPSQVSMATVTCLCKPDASSGVYYDEK